MNRVTVHDAATGETYERDATPEEIAFYEELAAAEPPTPAPE